MLMGSSQDLSSVFEILIVLYDNTLPVRINIYYFYHLEDEE